MLSSLASEFLRLQVMKRNNSSSNASGYTTSNQNRITMNDGSSSSSKPVWAGNERRFALSSLERDASRVWKTIPEANRHELDFVLAALKSPILPPKNEFERAMEHEIRNHREVILGFAVRPDFAEIYYTRHLFVPQAFAGDKDIMINYVAKIPRALQECTEELCNDRDMVLAAVKLGGLELQYASRRLQDDKELVVTACEKDGRALEYCPPGPTRDELTSDRNFMLKVLGNKGGQMFRLVPEPLKNDRALLLEALAHGMRFRCVPDEYKENKVFVLHALARSSKLYMEVFITSKDPDLALAAATAPDSDDEVHRKALLAAPQLKENRDVIMAIALRGDQKLLESVFSGGGAQQYLDDKPLMLAAVQRDCKLFKYAREALREDPEIIMAGIQEESAVDTMREISPDVRRRFPEISIKAIEVTPTRRLRYLEPLIPEELRRNHDVIMAWLNKGGNVLEGFERIVATNREMGLAIAKNNWTNFKKVGLALRSNKEYMMEAVQLDGRILRFAGRDVMADFDVCVRAVANHHRALLAVIYQEASFRKWVKAKLDLHLTFVKDFLRGIAINKPHVPPAKRSSLHLLDRGIETSQALKQKIAEFVGVPVGEELKIMRQAWTNLTYPPSNVDVSDRDRDREELGALEDDMVNILGIRRRERWEQRMQGGNRDAANGADDGAQDGAVGAAGPVGPQRDDEAGRARFQDRLMAAHRGGAAGMFAAPPPGVPFFAAGPPRANPPGQLDGEQPNPGAVDFPGRPNGQPLDHEAVAFQEDEDDFSESDDEEMDGRPMFFGARIDVADDVEGNFFGGRHGAIRARAARAAARDAAQPNPAVDPNNIIIINNENRRNQFLGMLDHLMDL